MPDYHVASLTYSVTSSDDVTYDAPPLVFETDESEFHLTDGTLVCRMKAHFASQNEARAAIESFLHAWELDADLRLGLGALRFQFNSAEVVDRTPVPPGITSGQIYVVEQADTMHATATQSAHITRRAYPAPPGDFRITEDVEILWHHYQEYLQGRERLLDMAYFCLTVLQVAAGAGRDARRKAAEKYKIEAAVLKQLGELSSRRGDSRTARKMPTRATPPLSGPEDAWIQATIKQIIWRLGDQRSSANLPTITMADLPPI